MLLNETLQRAKEAAEALRQEGIVPLGGWAAQPHLSMNYARAARSLYTSTAPGADLAKVVAPIFFLARHAVELALKDLLLTHHEVETEWQEIAEFDQVASKAAPLTAETLGRISRTHALGELLTMVQNAMPRYVTPNLKELVQLIDEHERGVPERFRYRTVRSRDGADREKMVPSFEKPGHVEIGAVIHQLDAFMKQSAEILEGDEDTAVEWSALQDLYFEGTATTQQLHQRGLL